MNTILPGNFPAPLVQIRQQGADEYAAEVVGLPAIQATGRSREEAIEQVRMKLSQLLATGQLAAVVVQPLPGKAPGWAEHDPLEQEFVAELERRRQEDLERTLREYEREDNGCSGSSSTPTT